MNDQTRVFGCVNPIIVGRSNVPGDGDVCVLVQINPLVRESNDIVIHQYVAGACEGDSVQIVRERIALDQRTAGLTERYSRE